MDPSPHTANRIFRVGVDRDIEVRIRIEFMIASKHNFEGEDDGEQFGTLVCWRSSVVTAWKGFGIDCVGSLAGFEASGCGADGGGMAVTTTAAVDVDFHRVDHLEKIDGDA